MAIVLTEESPLYKMTDFNYTIMRIEEQEDSMNNDQHSFSIASHLQKKLAASRIDDVLEIANASFSILFAVIYTVESYYVDVEMIMQGVSYTPFYIEIVDILVIIILLGDWTLFLFLHHEDRMAYLFSVDSFINFITIIPTGLIRFQVIIDQYVIQDYFLHFWRVLRLFSVLRLDKVFARRNLPIPRAYFKLILAFIMILFIFTCAFLELENYYKILGIREEMNRRKDAQCGDNSLCPNLPYIFPPNKPCDPLDINPCYANPNKAEKVRLQFFLEMIYYMVVTIATVGYGDICPTKPPSMILFIFIEIVVFSVLPIQYSEFSKANNLTSLFSRQKYQPSKREAKHILLLGDC